MKTIVKLNLLAAMLLASSISIAQDAEPSQILFKNVNIFDGVSEELTTDQDVLVEGNLIKQVGAGLSAGPNATVIDGGGKTLMPGLIDSHVHLNMYKDGTLVDLQNSTWEEIGARATAMAREMLSMGFTTVRDMCGAHDGLKKVIDAGLLEGPRVYLAGACLSQTGGHGDWGIAGQRKGESNLERLEITRLVDGRAEMLTGARRNFALGAHYLKIMVSGGVTSTKDPIYQSAFSDGEISAAVETAADYDSYVGMHVFQDSDLGRALDLGVKVVDHGLNISEKTMKKLVKKEHFSRQT
jgi:imidazolonepropionase-like amidohydrolase